ncbi:MAG: phage repressor protein/antirepressor Ant [Spirochaetae bacterium HGW-Spirochaetae-5]|nr:MAG: phage repressor protein/antirepressor Ant [Spirochaetae bacterium HGW-Spirochaetae-5]
MNDLQIFNYESKQIRTVIINNEPWWVAKDVCDILELNNITESLRRIDPSDLTSIKLNSGGQNREMMIVNESGLYSLILRSNKPEAKNFRKWITSEVLPSIRKTGQYNIETDPSKLIAQAVLVANRILEEQRPLVEFAKSVRESKNGVLVRHLAKNLRPATGEKRLYEWLRQNKIIMPESTEPYQQYIDSGYFEMRENVFDVPEGGKHISYTSLVTGKGQIYIEKKWREQHERPSFSNSKHPENFKHTGSEREPERGVPALTSSGHKKIKEEALN